MFQNDENLPITVDGEIDNPNTKNKNKNNSHKKNKRNGKNRNNNKKRKRKRKRNSGRRNNTRRNGRYLWYSVFTVDDLLVSKLILFYLLKWKIFILIQQLVHTNTKKNCVLL